MKYKNLYIIDEKNLEGRILLTQIDLLKRSFGITARRIYKKARVDESFGNKVLHGKKIGKPTLKKIDQAVFYFKHLKKNNQSNF